MISRKKRKEIVEHGNSKIHVKVDGAPDNPSEAAKKKVSFIDNTDASPSNLQSK